MSKFNELFGSTYSFIPCIHLLPLPGAPLYGGSVSAVIDHALSELEILKGQDVSGVIVENFRDKPFYPRHVPTETIAAMAVVVREVAKSANIPIGVNVLRNDAEAAVSIATAAGAHFIRVNIHMNAVVADQGIIEGVSYRTLRLRAGLKSGVLIFADVGVKHAAPLADRGLAMETKDLTERGLVDAIIVSGELTGAETKIEDVDLVRSHTNLPLLIGSGASPETLKRFAGKVRGFIVGSYVKKDGIANNFIDENRVANFTSALRCME